MNNSARVDDSILLGKDAVQRNGMIVRSLISASIEVGLAVGRVQLYADGVFGRAVAATCMPCPEQFQRKGGLKEGWITL